MTNTNTLMTIDSNGIAHTTRNCEEFTAPALGSMMTSKILASGNDAGRQMFLICADCD